jgi:hypothetical protein
MMDKVITEGQTACIFPFSGSGHEVNEKQYDFYDNLFRMLLINEYSYYGEPRRLPDVYAAEAPPHYCFYCVPGVWINGNVEPRAEFNVPFYGDDIVFPELLVPCLNTSILLPPRFHHLAGVEPDTVYDYDFPCVAVGGQLSNSVHLAPLLDTMQIEGELYAKKYNMGLAVYSAIQSGNFMPIVKNKLQGRFSHICLFMPEPPRDWSLPYYDLGGGYHILFLPANMESDGMGYIIPRVGLGEISVKATHIVQKGDKLVFR